jgi:AbrB family looped-hinge helix DNA binding protein
MTTKVSTKGQVVLPRLLRHKLGIRAGDSLEARIEAGHIVLVPQKNRRYKTKIIKDPITGFPVLSAGPNAPVLSSKDVREMLADFP